MTKTSNSFQEKCEWIKQLLALENELNRLVEIPATKYMPHDLCRANRCRKCDEKFTRDGSCDAANAPEEVATTITL